MTDDPKRIWLEPSCVPGGERCWSEDHPGDCCEEGCEMPAIEYIRADLAPQPQEPTPEAVERAAKAAWDKAQFLNVWDPAQSVRPWPPRVPVEADEWRETIRAALLAAAAPA